MNKAKKRYDSKWKVTRIALGDYALLKEISLRAGVSMAEALHKLITGQPQPKPEPNPERIRMKLAIRLGRWKNDNWAMMSGGGALAETPLEIADEILKLRAGSR